MWCRLKTGCWYVAQDSLGVLLLAARPFRFTQCCDHYYCFTSRLDQKTYHGPYHHVLLHWYYPFGVLFDRYGQAKLVAHEIALDPADAVFVSTSHP